MKIKKSLKVALFTSLLSCSCVHSTGNMDDQFDFKIADKIDIPKFMGRWYVLAGRFTFLEKEVHNSVETYTWNEKEKRIDIDFRYNKGSVTGPVKTVPQTGWIFNTQTNSHWKVSPFWPLKMDYLVVAVAADYSWTVIGVPNQKYLWIMARDYKNAEATIAEAMKAINTSGYRSDQLDYVPHKY